MTGKHRVRTMTQTEEHVRERGYSRAIGLACLRQWWYTGACEVAVGLWAIVAGVIFLICHDGGALTLLGALLLLVAVVVPFRVLHLLDDSFIIPSGICIVRPERTSASVVLVVGTSVIFVFLAVYDVLVVRSATLALGLVLSSALAVAFVRSDRTRYLVMAGLVLVPFVFAPQMATLLSLGESRSCGLAAVLAGLVLLSGGLHTLVGTFSAGGDDNDEFDDDGGDEGWFSLQQIQAALTSDDRDLRLLAVLFLSDDIESEALPEIIRLTRDPDVVVAHAACHALAGVWGPDPEDIIRWKIERRFRNRESVRLVSTEQIEALNRERLMVERRSLQHERHIEQALGSLVATDKAVLDDLIALASSLPLDGYDGGEARVVAAELLGATRDHRAYATLIHLMLTGERSIRTAAAEGFRGASPAAAVHLRPLLADSREWVRVNAVNAALNLVTSLQDRNPQEEVQAKGILQDDVIALVGHPSPVTRATSLELLAQYAPEVTGDIERMCDDRFAFVRGEAIRALTLSDATSAPSHVLVALNDSHAFVRMTALNCVGYLRQAEALPKVTALVGDPDEQVASLARRVLFVSKTW